MTVIERVERPRDHARPAPVRPDLIVVDVSFISLTKVLPAVLGAAPPSAFDCLAMVKPQFEVGRERIGKGGVVRDPELRREAVQAVADAARRRRGDGQRAVGARGPVRQPRDVPVAGRGGRAPGAVDEVEAW